MYNIKINNFYFNLALNLFYPFYRECKKYYNLLLTKLKIFCISRLIAHKWVVFSSFYWLNLILQTYKIKSIKIRYLLYQV
jgi:hypothetical protein